MVGLLGEVSKSVALPAAAATLAYLNARYGVSQDLSTIYQGVTFQRHVRKLDKADRVNAFYVLEQHALNPTAADRKFLVLPPDTAGPGEKLEWTYQEAYEIVLKYARWLKEIHGVQKNDKVAIDVTNRPLFIWLWFGLWSLGAKPAFINTNLRGAGFVHCVGISLARLLLIDPLIRDVLNDETRQALGANVEAHIVEADIEAGILAGSVYRAPDAARSGDSASSLAILIYTSGTTGLPKATSISWTRCHIGGCVLANILELTPEDHFFTALPLYHSAASLLGVMLVLGPGCSIALAPRFSARSFIKQAGEVDATVMQYIGELCRYLVASPPSQYDRAHRLRVAFGNGLRPDVWQRFKDRFNVPNVLEFYGASEGPSVLRVYERNGFLRGAVGRSGVVDRLLLGRNSILVKYDHNKDMPLRDAKTGFCVRCGVNESGEQLNQLDPANIAAKFQGYFGNEQATSSKIIRDVFKRGDAYYRTGDLLRLDEEGRWWFVDRVGDTFRWRSENVSTAEVSEALGSHPALREANVYGVSLPNHDGRAGCAAIDLIEGRVWDSELRRDLAAHARKLLPRYAVPLFLRLTKDMQVTGTLKHQKVALRAAGVDPSKTEGDELFWLPPDSESYQPFGAKEWERIVNGSAKL